MYLTSILPSQFPDKDEIENNLHLRYYRTRKIIFCMEFLPPEFYLDHQTRKHIFVGVVLQPMVLALSLLELVLIYSVYLTLENYYFCYISETTYHHSNLLSFYLTHYLFLNLLFPSYGLAFKLDLNNLNVKQSSIKEQKDQLNFHKN